MFGAHAEKFCERPQLEENISGGRGYSSENTCFSVRDSRAPDEQRATHRTSKTMALQFPNVSRNYDAEHRRIRFWGHDNALEVSFFLDENAIFRLNPRTKNVEDGMLGTFDESIDKIHQVAGRLYASGKRSFYVLAAEDFK
jgi:Protein of unknown function (DUF1488)